MCDFLPLIFIWGCPTKITQDNSGPAMICPRCHNPSVHGAKSRMWFEFCFVPLIPCNSDAIWYCPICAWDVPQAGNPTPALAAPGYAGPGGGGGGGGVYQQPGYQQPPNAGMGWGGQQQGPQGYGQAAYPPPPPGHPGTPGTPGLPGQGGYQQGGAYQQPYPPPGHPGTPGTPGQGGYQQGGAYQQPYSQGGAYPQQQQQHPGQYGH